MTSTVHPTTATETQPLMASIDRDEACHPPRLTAGNLRNLMMRAKWKLRSVLLLKKTRCNLELFGTWPETQDNQILSKIVCKENPHLFATVEPVPDDAWCLIMPETRFKRAWNLFLLLLILYILTVTPWVIAFEELSYSNPFFYSELVVDCCFFADIVITLNSAYIAASGGLIVSRRKIFCNYLKGTLLIDLLSVFPFFLVFDSENEGRSNSLIRLVRVLKLAKVVRASKLSSLFRFFEDIEELDYLKKIFQVNKGLGRLLACIFVVLLFAHFSACMWYFTARLEDMSEDTWVVRYGFEDAGKGRLYLVSFYWAFTVLTTVGFGDIAGYTSTEMMLCITWMFLGVGFYSFIISTLTSIVSNLDAKAARIQERKAKAETFGRVAGLPSKLVKKIKKQIKREKVCESLTEDQTIELMRAMPLKLRAAIAYAMHEQAVVKLRFFKDKCQALICDIMPRLAVKTYEDHTLIYKKREAAEGVYFIIEGRVCFLVSRQHIIFNELREGSDFGEIELLNNSAREFTVGCRQPCQLLFMDRSTFYYMMTAYPYLKGEIKQLAAARSKLNAENKARIEAELNITRFPPIHRPTTTRRSDILYLPDRIERVSDTLADLQEELAAIKTFTERYK